MCQTPRTCRRPQTTPTGKAAWLVSFRDAADLIDAGRCAPCRITVERRDGEYTGHYWLGRNPLGGWLLSREGNDAEGSDVVHYELSGDLWSCGCPAYRQSGNLCTCKHLVAVRALLTAAGILAAKEVV